MPEQQRRLRFPSMPNKHYKGREYCAPFRNVIVGILILFLNVQEHKKQTLAMQTISHKGPNAKEEFRTLVPAYESLTLARMS
jgi:hypothetical protein